MKNTICKYAFRNLNTIRIEFVKELNNDPAMRNDISEDHDMSVVSWWGGDENNIFYVASTNGEPIIANKNSSYMFEGCLKLKEIVGLEMIDFSKVEIMEGMFYDCESLESLNLSSFDTKNCNNMMFMFFNCKSIKELDLSNFDTSNVKDMSRMFSHCYGLTAINLSSFDTKKVENMDYMFRKCCDLTNIDLSNFNTENAISMVSMFDECKNLREIDIDIMSSFKYVYGMFSGCNSLKHLNICSKQNSNMQQYISGNIDVRLPEDVMVKFAMNYIFGL